VELAGEDQPAALVCGACVAVAGDAAGLEAHEVLQPVGRAAVSVTDPVPDLQSLAASGLLPVLDWAAQMIWLEEVGAFE
jgi:hypothetical protein